MTAQRSPSLDVVVLGKGSEVTKVSRELRARGHRAHGTTFDGALAALLTHRPGVVLVDLREDQAVGTDVIRLVMDRAPVPMVALLPHPRAQSLDLVDAVVVSPNAEVDWTALARTLSHAARVPVGRRRRRNQPSAQVVAVVASLGGPQALARLVAELPVPFALPMLVCQHITAGHTGAFASWLAAQTGRRVAEAVHGQSIEPGAIWVAPSNHHLAVDRQRRLVLDGGPPVGGFRPSGDVLLSSVAEAYGETAIGLILTGLGHDGARGLRLVREKGGRTIVQSPEASVASGMPAAAIARNAAQQVVPLEEVSRTLRRMVAE